MILKYIYQWYPIQIASTDGIGFDGFDCSKLNSLNSQELIF